MPNNVFEEEYIEYTSTEGMTWGEWVNSEYNVDGFYFNSHLCSPNGVIKGPGGGVIKEFDVIIENYYYHLEP